MVAASRPRWDQARGDREFVLHTESVSPVPTVPGTVKNPKSIRKDPEAGIASRHTIRESGDVGFTPRQLTTAGSSRSCLPVGG
jgi:hypothetical protein